MMANFKTNRCTYDVCILNQNICNSKTIVSTFYLPNRFVYTIATGFK